MKTLFIGGEESLDRSFHPMADKNSIHLLYQTLFDHSKHLLGYSIFTRILVYLLGIIVLVFIPTFQQLPFLVAIFAMIAELLQWRSEYIKSIAESLLRKFEYHDGFGWPILKLEISDILARVPVNIRKSIPSQDPDYQYFESKEVVGPKRVIENLIESAWWSKHLSETAIHVFLTITLLTIIGSFAILIISIETVQNYSILTNVSRIVTSTLLLLFSLRLIRNTVDYYSLNRKAGQIETKANDILQSQNFDKDKILKVLIEYQFVRNSSPLIPTWIWKARRETLNDLWKISNE